MSVSLIIKALNEEKHIARAVESALAGLLPGSEVILADGGSVDRTVEIAKRYPVRIVRLLRAKDRSCGAGPQLGYQYATGRFLCLMDGDMVLDPGFIAAGLAFLRDHPDVAGVGGGVTERNLTSVEYQRRVRRGTPDLVPGPVDRLSGGGLYRTEAVASVGYLSDRNLHGHEEYDLGVRLRAAGWTLRRLPVPFVDHHGHASGGYALLWRRLRSRYAYGSGEVLRAAVGRPHFRQILADLPELRLWVGVHCGWLAALAVMLAAPSIATALAGLFGLALAPVAALSLRYRSIRMGTYAFAAWNIHAIGFALGFVRRRVPPGLWLDSVEVEGSGATADTPTDRDAEPALGAPAGTMRHV